MTVDDLYGLSIPEALRRHPRLNDTAKIIWYELRCHTEDTGCTTADPKDIAVWLNRKLDEVAEAYLQLLSEGYLEIQTRTYADGKGKQTIYRPLTEPKW